jgi:hypothetical protein
MGLLRCFQTDLEDVDDDDNKVPMILNREILRMQDYFLILKKSREDVIKALQAIVLSDTSRSSRILLG